MPIDSLNPYEWGSQSYNHMMLNIKDTTQGDDDE